MTDSNSTNSIHNAAKEVYEMLLRRQYIEATQLADELTSDAMAQWNRQHDTGSAADLLVASCALAETKIATGKMKSAINIALTATTNTIHTEDAVEEKMMCYLTAWNALEQILNLTTPDDTRRQAVADATRELGTLLYHYYYATGKSNPLCTALQDTYEALKVITTLVTVSRQCNPQQSLHMLITSLSAAGLID